MKTSSQHTSKQTKTQQVLLPLPCLPLAWCISTAAQRQRCSVEACERVEKIDREREKKAGLIGHHLGGSGEGHIQTLRVSTGTRRAYYAGKGTALLNNLGITQTPIVQNRCSGQLSPGATGTSSFLVGQASNATLGDQQGPLELREALEGRRRRRATRTTHG